MRTLIALLALACPLLALPGGALAQGQPRSIAECEKVKGDLAYNQCLASFGPKRGERAPRGAQPTPEQLQTAAPEPESSRAGRRGRRGRAAVALGRSGRQSASFDIIAGRGSYGRRSYGRRSYGRPRVSRRFSGRRSYYRRRR